ncbi:hypothetical protein [Clostridium aciditolerans]|uniref:Uncharacterized protein n=1 Tax=Clostridium aciditolerans TaxID=339861 RepID=A0A934I2G6_9CLOT|nr:hypothetical protein [Clostridium aciditolerans]MBI6875604.1 hypothetical protein [Clostridium aciditolerans]
MKNENLEEFLESLIGKKLFKHEQKILKKVFEENGLKARMLGINTINAYLKDIKKFYIIEERKGHWIVGKIVFEENKAL